MDLFKRQIFRFYNQEQIAVDIEVYEELASMSEGKDWIWGQVCKSVCLSNPLHNVNEAGVQL